MNYTSKYLLLSCIGFYLIVEAIRVFAEEQASIDTRPSILQQLDAYILEQTAIGRIDKADIMWKQKLPVFPSIDFSAPYRVWAVMETPTGSVRIAFRPEAAPRYVANFFIWPGWGFTMRWIFSMWPLAREWCGAARLAMAKVLPDIRSTANFHPHCPTTNPVFSPP